MLLRELLEAKPTAAAIMFGRFNPPHFGHVDAWKVAANFPVWYIGTNQSTQGPKDPLPFEIKIEAMKTLYPEIEGHLVAEQNWFTLAVKVFKELGEDITLKVVTDPEDKDIYVSMIQKQNGIQGPHGYYKFQSIEWEPSERKSEASLVRKSVKENNPADFKKYSGTDPNMPIAGRPYFELVRKYMLPYMQAEEEDLKKKQERERIKAEKEKAKAEKKDKKNSGMDLATLRSAAKNAKPASELKGVAEDAEPMDREFALVKKLGRLGERIVQNPKLWAKYEEANNSDNTDWIVSLIMDGTGATFKEVLRLSDLFGEIGGGMGRIIDFAWAVKEGTWEEDFMDPYRKHKNQDVEEGDKKPHPKTWHDVDPKLGKQVDKMTQAEKVKKGLAHPGTLKKKKDLEEYGDTAKGQKMLTKVQKRAVDRMIKAADKGDAKTAGKNQDTANRAWDRMDTSEDGSKAMAHTAKSLENPPKVMQHRAKRDQEREKQLKYRDIAKRNESFDLKTSLQELSNDMLGKYKKAASADASKADKEGNFRRGDKRFSGIVKATKKQFDNDAKDKK